MNDLIQLIDILDDNDLKTINDYAETLEFGGSSVFNTTGGQRADTDIRSSSGSSFVEGTDATVLLHTRINQGLEKYYKKVSSIHQNFSYYPVPCGMETTCWREGIQCLEYVDGQHYKFHHDCATDPSRQEYERKLSIILYLTDDFLGGGTEFIHKTFKPKAGTALMFPSNWCYPHSGQPVTEGKKRVAVTWYYVDGNFNKKKENV